MSSRRRRDQSEIQRQGQYFAALPGVGDGLRVFLRRHGLEVRRLQHDGLSSRWHGDDVGLALAHAGLLWNGKPLTARQLAKQLYLAQQIPAWQDRQARRPAARQGQDPAMHGACHPVREFDGATSAIRPEREPAKARADPGLAREREGADFFDPETLKIRTLALGERK